MAKYELDLDDRELVESVLALAQRVVDLQYDESVERELQNQLLDTAELFGIETHEMWISEHEDGTITVSVKDEELEEPAVRKPNLRVISNDDKDDKIH